MSSRPEISVLIPTHNPRIPVLSRVLEALRAQTLSAEFCEILLVDNHSSPPLSGEFGSVAPERMTIIREDRLGLAYARVAGIRASRAPIIVFVDDDNVLAPTYLATVRTYFSAHPDVGVIGGRIIGEFAHPPPSWATTHLGHLALRDFGDKALVSSHRGQISDYDAFAPFGAGMAIRSEICRFFVETIASGGSHAIGRKGNQLGGCEDCEFLIAAWRAGLECAYVPTLSLTHVIPASRLTFSYLQRLARQGQQSWAEFRCRHGLTAPIPKWTVPLRQGRAFFRMRAWTRSGFITWRGACGFFAGAASGARKAGG